VNLSVDDFQLFLPGGHLFRLVLGMSLARMARRCKLAM
jgi:hypothetical protein